MNSLIIVILYFIYYHCTREVKNTWRSFVEMRLNLSEPFDKLTLNRTKSQFLQHCEKAKHRKTYESTITHNKCLFHHHHHHHHPLIESLQKSPSFNVSPSSPQSPPKTPSRSPWSTIVFMKPWLYFAHQLWSGDSSFLRNPKHLIIPEQQTLLLHLHLQ